MNETQANACLCNDCPGQGCTCGCQHVEAKAPCACGEQCACGDACACE